MIWLGIIICLIMLLFVVITKRKEKTCDTDLISRFFALGGKFDPPLTKEEALEIYNKNPEQFEDLKSWVEDHEKL